MNSRIRYITETAVMLAMLIILQAVTKSLGQIVTGSCVNFVLAMSVLVSGLAPGLTVAVLSPFFAFLLGIGPAFLPLVPGIAAGNAVLVLIVYFIIGKAGAEASPAIKTAGTAAAALGKFLALFVIVVKLILPLLSVNEKQAAVITASFSWPQLVTAAIGTTLAVILYPRIRKAVRHQ